MINFGRSAFALVALASLTLTGCASSGVGAGATAYTDDIAPIQSVPVSSTALPPVDGSTQTASGLPTQTDPGALAAPQPLSASTQVSSTGQAFDPGVLQSPNAQPATPATTQVASTDGSFVTLDSVGQVPATPGRDLAGGLNIEKLLGGWTVVAGANQCKLNLTYTQKTGTSRYRASTPGCGISGLNVVASWQLVGSQVQLFDENGDIIASLILSGNRFIGTVAGGQGISMVG
jgi:hypothetical protein